MIAGILLLCFSGCEKNTRYQVLSFFFTGVPTPEQIERQKKAAAAERQKKEKEKKPEFAAKKTEAPVREKATPDKARQLYSHTPYAGGRCSDCHGGASSFRGFRSKGTTPTFSKGGGMPGVLIAPRRQLCIKCHESLNPDQVALSGLWLHTAAASGECDACHDPHQSEHPGILTDPPEEICRKCHSGELLMKVPEHKRPGECLDCHNPHLGKNAKMLKNDYREKKSSLKQPTTTP